MSILIKGMDMPKNCVECPFTDNLFYCLLVDDGGEMNREEDSPRADSCPLIEVDENEIAMLANAYLEKEKADGNIC